MLLDKQPYRNIRDVLFLGMKIFVICACESQTQITNPELSSMGNQTVAGSNSSDIVSSASFGIQFFTVKSTTFHFLYRLKNSYDYI
jgi:hypothetical protein